MNLLDITDERFGFVTALEEVEPEILKSGKKKRRYKCRCDCGNIFITRMESLRAGKTTSCGCKRKEKIHDVKMKDISNMTFGRLTALQYLTSDKQGKAQWLCICSCGNYCTVGSDSLVSGITKSCGCLKSDTIRSKYDLVGKTFGHLTVERRIFIEEQNKKYAYYECKCDCGNTCICRSQNLLRSHTTSCGHIVSKMEEEVNSYLINNGYNFKSQISFNDLKRHDLLRFDFGLYDDEKLICLIECNGRQHYDDVGKFGKTQRETTDKMKKDYCINNGICLYVIKYDDDIIEKLKEIIEEVHVNPVPRSK